MRIIAASQNKHKLEEINAITSEFGMSLVSMKDAGLGDLDVEENEGTVKAFLAQHPEMVSVELEHLPQQLMTKQQDGMLQVFPQDIGSDGFFVAAFVKKGE